MSRFVEFHLDNSSIGGNDLNARDFIVSIDHIVSVEDTKGDSMYPPRTCIHMIDGRTYTVPYNYMNYDQVVYILFKDNVE